MPAPFRFEEFDLDLERYELRRSGQAVKLERIPMELLILLLQNNGKLVRREAINRRLWGENTYQDTDHSVNTAVNKLRYILRDDPRDPRFIQTVVGQGYRFIAELAADPIAEDSPAASPGAQKSPPSCTCITCRLLTRHKKLGRIPFHRGLAFCQPGAKLRSGLHSRWND